MVSLEWKSLADIFENGHVCSKCVCHRRKKYRFLSIKRMKCVDKFEAMSYLSRMVRFVVLLLLLC